VRDRDGGRGAPRGAQRDRAVHGEGAAGRRRGDGVVRRLPVRLQQRQRVAVIERLPGDVGVDSVRARVVLQVDGERDRSCGRGAGLRARGGPGLRGGGRARRPQSSGQRDGESRGGRTDEATAGKS